MKSSLHPTRLLTALVALLAISSLIGANPAAASRPSGSDALPALAPQRVGLQVGHWQIDQLPAELERLRSSTGAYAAGRSEWQVNLDLARRAAVILRSAGVTVDILPATVPTGYTADAFVAIHADANGSTQARGYKVATRWRSTVAWRDQLLMETLGSQYATTTGLPQDPSVTRGMRGYYAFSTFMGTDYRVGKFTPAAIIETGFMSNAADRAILFNQPDVAASGIARGILAYLRLAHNADATQQQAEQVAAAQPSERSVIVTDDGVRIRSAADGGGRVLRVASRGDVYPYADRVWKPPANYNPGPHSTELATGGWTKIRIPGYDGDAYISRDYINIQQPGEPD